jgi:hypothetical protein
MANPVHYPPAQDSVRIGFLFGLFGRQAKPLLQQLSVDALVTAPFLDRAAEELGALGREGDESPHRPDWIALTAVTIGVQSRVVETSAASRCTRSDRRIASSGSESQQRSTERRSAGAATKTSASSVALQAQRATDRWKSARSRSPGPSSHPSRLGKHVGHLGAPKHALTGRPSLRPEGR